MKRYLGYQFKQSTEKLIRKIAAEFQVSVGSIEWSHHIPTAGINDRGTIVLADVADDAVLYDIDVQRYAGFAVHELLHWKYTDFAARCTYDPYLDQLHNACEDAWIEHTGIDASLTGNIGGLLTALLDQIVGEANATVTDWTDPRQYPFIFAVYLRRHINTYVPVPEGLEPIIHEASKRINDCHSSADTLELAKWIKAQLSNLSHNPPPPQKKDSSQEGAPQSGNGRLEKNPHKSPGAARAPGGDAAQVEPSLCPSEKTAGPGSWSENACLARNDRHVRLPWLKDDHAVSARLRYEVKRLFDDSGMDEFQKNRRAGSVNVGALHKIGLTDKLFQRRHQQDGIDSAVVICVDVSGSMFDEGTTNKKYATSNRIVQAALTTKALLETLQRAQVSTCVLTFGSQTSVLKSFEENPKKSLSKIGGLTDGGSTNDYFAVRYAHKLLLSRPEQRKIAFVITDGVGKAGHVRRQCKAGENLGITTIGVGIEANIQDIYPQAVCVNDIKELGSVSFKQIKIAV